MRTARRRWLPPVVVLLTLVSLLLIHVGRVASMPVPRVSVTAAEEGVDGTVLGGVLHVHTTASDGKGDFDEVAKAAEQAGLDFIVLADHNVDPPAPHFRHGVLMVPGVELSTLDGHVLAAGARRTAGWRLRWEDSAAAARYAGGMTILAHPVNRRLPWSGSWSQADGMEVVSYDSLYRDAFAHPIRKFLPALLTLPGSRTIAVLSLHHRPDEAFERWEEHSGLVGVCAHDAHGYEGYFGPFSAMQLRVRLDEPLPEDPEEATDVFMDALVAGRVWCTLGGLADPSGFSFRVWGDPPEVRASLAYDSWPSAARPRVLLFHDGREVAEGEFEAAMEEAPPGAYRAEVHLDVPWIWTRREFLWIFTSNVFVEDP